MPIRFSRLLLFEATKASGRSLECDKGLCHELRFTVGGYNKQRLVERIEEARELAGGKSCEFRKRFLHSTAEVTRYFGEGTPLREGAAYAASSISGFTFRCIQSKASCAFAAAVKIARLSFFSTVSHELI